jgi:hypothetical protein
MKSVTLLSMFLLLLLDCCSTGEKQIGSNFYQQISVLPFIEGKTQYLMSPFVTAGDRVYIGTDLLGIRQRDHLVRTPFNISVPVSGKFSPCTNRALVETHEL